MRKLCDNDIIESIQKGNRDDFALLVDKYKDKAFNLLRRMLRNEMDAEEVLQDSFLKAFMSMNNFRHESKFSTWFYRIVYNTGLSFLQSKRKKTELKLDSLEDHNYLNYEDGKILAVEENSIKYLSLIIDKLPIRNALVIILYYIDDLKLSEISEILDISLVNAKVLLHRSRNILRDLIFKHNYQKELL
ncbi:ECF RNA polymerase sigma factor SigW [bacterium BMS3Abin04]|nr:ECF RNA polymerase sigma factor SigW [bacterium BMS3Abin04]